MSLGTTPLGRCYRRALPGLPLSSPGRPLPLALSYLAAVFASVLTSPPLCVCSSSSFLESRQACALEGPF